MYGIDVQVPGMVYGMIGVRRCAAPARNRSMRDEIKKLPGIIEAVAFDNGVGIVGKTVEAVFAARHS